MSSKSIEMMNTNKELISQQLIQDVRDIFSTMVGLDDLLHLPIQIDPQTHFKDCVSSMVGLAGSFNGLVSMHMPCDIALKATSSMLGMNVTEHNDDVSDALGEIANMIAGSFKHQLSKGGMDIKLSTPSIVYGKEYMVKLISHPDQVTVKFATENDWFMVAVAFENN
jgi:chemotaxis protein CheX